MASSVNFSVVERKNPLKPMLAPKYYALAQSRGEKDVDTCHRMRGFSSGGYHFYIHKDR